MIINGIEFEFDSAKLSDLDKYEEAHALLKPEVAKGDKLIQEGKLGTGARTYIRAFRAFFQKVAGLDVVGDTEDYMLCLALFEDFTQQIAEQKQKTRESYFSHKKGRH